MAVARGSDLDLRVGARVARRLPALLWALSAAFAFFALLTLLTRPPGATVPLAALDGAGAVLFAVGALAAARRDTARWANAAAGVAFLVVIAASLVALKLLHEPSQTTNLLVIELVASVILLSLAWAGVVLAVTVVGWSVVAWTEGFDAAWQGAGAALVVTTIMSVMVQVVRLRDARESERLAVANQEKATRLERAVTSERAHVQALANANQSLEAFSYVISHDLKEPIRAMGFYLQEARATEDEGERDELLDRAVSSHADLSRLVQGLLEWSRATTTPLEAVEVDVDALLRDPSTRALFERVLLERRAKLLLEAGLPQVLGTPALVRQVLGNLILNAVRHNPREDAQVRVYAASDAPRGMVDLIVEDNGPGFPPTVLREPAAGAPRSVRHGFGLQIVRRAVERLGGQLHLANREDGGARVHVVLPAVKRRERAFEQRVRELV